MLGNVPAPRDLPTSASATGELAALAPHVERIRAASASAFAPATRRAYGGSWARFLAWADGEGLQALPAPPAAVAAYLAHRSEDGRSLATLRMDRQAIRAAHIEAGGPDPTASEGVRRVLRGLSRQRAGEGRRQAAALTAEALGAIRATAATPRTGPTGRTESPEAARRRGAVDIALASVMRDAMLRRSEATALTWADVEFRSDGSGRLTVTRSKTDQEGEGAVQYLGRFAARALRRIRGTDPAGRVFGLRSGRSAARRLAAMAKAAGLEGAFSGHSARVGMARDLVAHGASVAAVQVAGRWASSRMPAYYARGELAARGAVAQFYGD